MNLRRFALHRHAAAADGTTAAPTTSRRKAVVIAGLAVGTVAVVAGCSSAPTLTIEQLPLPAPGGLTGGPTINAVFTNALNLPTKAKVKIGGNDVGQVDTIKTSNYEAHVKMSLKKGTEVPVGSTAQLRQATPLGDVFLAIIPTDDTSRGDMKSGDTIPIDKTSAGASVEDLLVSASAFVDGGILNGATNLVHELSTAVGDHPQDVTTVIRGFTTAISKLNQNTGEINNSLATIDDLTGDLARGRDQLSGSVATLGPVLALVNGQINNILSLVNKSSPVTAAMNDFLGSETGNAVSMVDSLQSLSGDLRSAAGLFGPVSDKVAATLPQFAKSVRGSSAAVSSKLYWITPGYGFDSGSRLPELDDIGQGVNSLHQTLVRLLARLTGTQGCCG
ncbi:MlaD family protein [Jongsikchunia kroppenstedtii]|uniref:MlaD family protein n=1 Tax=Jongsikchunia kroppenstedtii TaxID=1121721 RepID=UPI0005BA5497|nr:MlaD family protein [Jongsikchunia kroppenstedtii]